MSTGQPTKPSYIYSRMSSDFLALLIAQLYEVSSPVRCEFFTLGLHDNYLVHAGTDRYVLRIYRTDLRSGEEIQFELELLTFLRQQGMPVSFPLMNNSGAYSHVLDAPEGTRYVALFSYAKGTTADRNFNEQQSHQLGKTVAELHQVADSFQSHHQRPHLSLRYLLDDSMALLAGCLQHRPADLVYLEQARNDAVAALDGLPTNSPIYGICLGDVHPGNAHFTVAGDITLFDFDQCGYGWRAFEIGKFLAVAHLRGFRNEVKRAFVAGYESIRSLDPTELAAVPHFVQVAQIWMLGIYARNVDLVGRMRLSDDFFTERLNLMKATEVSGQSH